jgi:cell division septum initiation protein DivIVA
MVSQNNDMETRFYRELTNIKELKREINSLKRRLGRLERRIETQELLDFQLQVTRLSEHLTSFSEEFNKKTGDYEHQLLGLQCYVSAAKVNEHLDSFCNIVESSKLRNKNDVQTQLIADAASTKSKIFASTHPQNLALDYYEKWSGYLKEKGISFVVM